MWGGGPGGSAAVDLLCSGVADRQGGPDRQERPEQDSAPGGDRIEQERTPPRRRSLPASEIPGRHRPLRRTRPARIGPLRRSPSRGGRQFRLRLRVDRMIAMAATPPLRVAAASARRAAPGDGHGSTAPHREPPRKLAGGRRTAPSLRGTAVPRPARLSAS